MFERSGICSGGRRPRLARSALLIEGATPELSTVDFRTSRPFPQNTPGAGAQGFGVSSRSAAAARRNAAPKASSSAGGRSETAA